MTERTDPSIRPARLADVDAMAELHAVGWREGFAGIIPFVPAVGELAARLRDRFDDPRGGRLVAELGGRLSGFCGFGPSRDDNAGPRVGEIYALFVHPRAWRRGVGGALVAAALEQLGRLGFAEVSLWSAAANSRANAFYERQGFSPDGAEQTRAELGVREVRYRRRLAEP